MSDDSSSWFSDAYDYVFGSDTPEVASYGPYADGGKYGDFLDDGSDNNSTIDWGASLTPSPAPSNEQSGWTRALTSPAVLSALVTSGAGLIGGLNNMNLQKEALKAQEEQKKMNQMLELAKLKYQLLSKGGGRSSGSRGGGSNRAQDLQNQYSANQASGYSSLGNNLASIYR